MATGSSHPKTSSGGGGISLGWGLVIFTVAIAIAWQAWPSGHKFIALLVLVLVFILWIQDSGRIKSQISTITSGKA